MKITNVLLSTLLLIGFSVYGQEDNQDKKVTINPSEHEINLGVMNLFGLSLPNQTSSGGSIKSIQGTDLTQYKPPSLALGYKYHIENSALRTGFGFSNYSAETKSDDPKQKESYSEFAIYAGYQYEWSFPRTAFYIGLDAIYETKNLELVFDQKPTYYEESTKKHQAYGSRPFLGLRVFLNKHVSFSTESYFYMRWYTLDLKMVDDEGAELGKSTINGSKMQFGALGLISVNYHF
ncbi:MAG: hypothetical protein K9H84_03490 [Bacteroidales bacterium]|nr:hypothetical protein [Bacteroidales bacterium]